HSVRLYLGGKLPGAARWFDHRHCFHGAPNACVCPEPRHTLGGAPHSAGIFRGRRELAHGAGVEGQESALGPNRELLGGGPPKKKGRDCSALSCAQTITFPSYTPA